METTPIPAWPFLLRLKASATARLSLRAPVGCVHRARALHALLGVGGSVNRSSVVFEGRSMAAAARRLGCPEDVCIALELYARRPCREAEDRAVAVWADAVREVLP